MRLDRVGPNTENVHQGFSAKRKKDREHSVALMCEVFWAVQNSSWCFSPHLPVGCCGKQDYQSLSGDCAHTSQSGVDRRNRSGRRSEGMMGDSAADSLNRRCAGMSPGTLPSPETPAYRAGSVYLFLKNSFGMRRGLGLGLNFLFFFSQLPGRADFRGVGLTVFLGALWVTALRIQRFNHYTNTHWKQILNKKILKRIRYSKCNIYIFSRAATKDENL